MGGKGNAEDVDITLTPPADFSFRKLKQVGGTFSIYNSFYTLKKNQQQSTYISLSRPPWT